MLINNNRSLAYTVFLKEIKQISSDILDQSGNPYTAIEHSRILDWWCVTKTGEFKPGDLAIYVEIDSVMPERPEFEFLRSKGFKIKTQKMCRGKVLSQGILFPLNILPSDFDRSFLTEFVDLTDVLGVKKYDPEEYSKDYGKILPSAAKGHFPSFIKQTDQERAQNCGREIETHTFEYEVTEKLEGSSITIFAKQKERIDNGLQILLPREIDVCSRKMLLKSEPSNDCQEIGTFWKTVRDLELDKKIQDACNYLNANLAFQGEIIGPGIQKNIYKLSTHQIRIFDIWDIDNSKYLRPKDRKEICDKWNVPHVPILFWTSNSDKKSVNELIKMADGKSLINNSVDREGLVFKHINDAFSFKAVSNLYLLSKKD